MCALRKNFSTPGPKRVRESHLCPSGEVAKTVVPPIVQVLEFSILEEQYEPRRRAGENRAWLFGSYSTHGRAVCLRVRTATRHRGSSGHFARGVGPGTVSFRQASCR